MGRPGRILEHHFKRLFDRTGGEGSHETRDEMPVKETKRQRIFDAICDPVSRLRVELKTSDVSKDAVDRKLRALVNEIWTKVKIEAGLRD